MKRVLVTAAILMLIPAVVWGFWQHTPMNWCPGVGTPYKFAWTTASGNTRKACISSVTSGVTVQTGTLSGATCTVNSYGYLDVGAINSYLQWTVSNGDVISTDEGTIYFTFQITTDGGTSGDVDQSTVIEVTPASYDNQNSIKVYVNDADNKLWVSHEGQNLGENAVVASSALTFGTVYRVGVAWKTGAGGGTAVRLNGGAWNAGAAGLLDSWAGAAPCTRFTLGENVLGSLMDGLQIWDVYVLPNYQAQDPQR